MTGKAHIKYSFSSVIIFLMTLCLSLPCSVKREIKTALNLSVSYQNPGKQEKSLICQSFIKDEQSGPSVSHQKELQKVTSSSYTGFRPARAARQEVIPVTGNKFIAAVPIYIVHEQYLI